VDDASTEADANAYLDSLDADFEKRGWRIIRHDRNRYPGAARNTAAAHASGDYLLFMDDDNYAKPHEIRTLVNVAQRTDADIVVCPCDVFSHHDEPAGDETPRNRWIPLGPALPAGLFRNCFGDLNALVRRSAFVRVGGCNEEYGVGFEDWEFYARAAFAGLRFEVVPEPLFWYRSRPGTMVHTVDRSASQGSVLRTYLANTDVSLHGLLRTAQEAFADGGAGSIAARAAVERLVRARVWQGSRSIRTRPGDLTKMPRRDDTRTLDRAESLATLNAGTNS
jgi:glycosyltransferase involved in cell wall biosynthesis